MGGAGGGGGVRSLHLVLVVVRLGGHVPDDGVVERGVREETADVRVAAPQVVADHLAAAEVLDLEAEVPIAFVRLVQRRVRVRSEELERRRSFKH